jgi:hypothetical protein
MGKLVLERKVVHYPLILQNGHRHVDIRDMDIEVPELRKNFQP